MSSTLELLKQLVERPSITPADAGCQDLIASRLAPLGFSVEKLQFGGVSNIWIRKGKEKPLFVFLGHTDVVPPGPEDMWISPPFTPTVRDGYLYGRGVADMKGGIAAFTTACERFLSGSSNRHQLGSIALLLTSDEEGIAVDGTVRVIEELKRRGEQIDYCLVGEPSSTERLGDVLKNGRRGSISGSLQVKGKQGHVAYPHLADNPIHKAFAALSELCATEWDKGNEFFPATTFQISNMNGGTGADNVIPAFVDIVFNWRFSSDLTAEQIKERCLEVLHRHKLDFELSWRHSGDPFLTRPGDFLDKICTSVTNVTGEKPELSTAGGTSDGRFVAPTGAQVVEVGVVNQTIHKINECVEVASLEKLSLIYENILELCLGKKASFAGAEERVSN
jgi:succinyl-diaminopimelate desuccinylase